MDLGVAGLFGSCVFNITILVYADPFYRLGILNNQAEPAHFVAGGVAIALILMGLLLIMGRHRLSRPLAALGLVAMVGLYLVGAAMVVTLGAAG
jgi:Ca2+/Na+ antiporter